MKRRQSADVSRMQPRPRAARKSMGYIYNRDISIRTHSNLLSEAIREDIHKRRLLAKFQFIIRFRTLLHRWWKRHSMSDVSSTHPLYMQFQMIDDLAENPAENAVNFKASYFKANKQMRMSQEAKRILTMKPEERSDAEIYYAMIALRGIDSIADYPLRMQRALATHGMFDSYGPKRLIVKQGHSPVWFYFILFGKVVVATMDKGSTYAKTRVTLKRGENFGAEELAIAHRTARQSTVITMEYTEFLTIDCDTYENIFMAGGVKTIHDPDHNRFMRSMFFLKDWPLEKLENNTKAMQFCFFRRNTVMVKDSNTSDWIYIVKSGSLKVYKKLVKCYPTVNKRTGNYREVANADGYFSFLSQENQYHRYALYNNIEMPPPLSPGDSDSDDGEGDHSEEKENLLSLPLMQRVERLIRPRTATAGVIATYGESTRHRNRRQIRSAKPLGNRTRSLVSPVESADDKPDGFDDSQQGKRTLVDDFEGGTKTKSYGGDKSDPVESGLDIARLCGLIPSQEEVEQMLRQEARQQRSEQQEQSAKVVQTSSDFNPNIISRNQTTFVTKMKEMTAADLDPEFVLVQTLTKGQAFGLQQIFLEDQPSMFLVSHGAECVMINKKFYKDNVDPNMETRLKQQISPYPTDEELQEKLRTRVNWERYRQISLENLVSRQRAGKPGGLNTKGKKSLFTG